MGVVSCGTTMLDQGVFQNIGAVTWDTTAKTASFTAVSGNGYFVNTTSGAVTMTLPSSPSAGDIVAVKDYAGTFATNNLTIARNGSNLEGSTNDKVVSTDFQNFTMVYVDGTQGWIATDSGTDTISTLPAFVTATGGTVTCCGDYKIHTFTGPGTFTVSCAGNPAGSNTVDYLVLAGGGGGGGSNFPGGGAGAGGAGGYRESDGGASGCYTTSPIANPCGALPVSVQGYPITVGGGGSGGPGASNGNPSIFSTITSTAGGYGGSPVSPQIVGSPGGSGGGGPWQGAPTNVGSGNTPPVSPPQGNPGGYGSGAPGYAGGGGGGALSAGNNAPGTAGGSGGGGATSSITASPVARAGGGGGGGGCSGTGGSASAGGGAGGNFPNGTGTAGTANTGGGGGAGAWDSSSGGNGGSGIVVIRYKFQ
jgi:hypothetical protein